MLRFTVQGSSGNEYEIIASRKEADFRMTCTCEAGRNGTYCKHRFSLLDGETSKLLSSNEHDVQALKSMFSGTEVERRYKMVLMLEEQKRDLETRLKSEKKALAREMNK